MNILLKTLILSFFIALVSSSCFGQKTNEKTISQKEIENRLEYAPKEWMKFEKQANEKDNLQEKRQGLISYGRWRLYRPNNQTTVDYKKGFSEKTLEKMIHMEKINGRGYGADLFTFGLNGSYHATGADYGLSIEEGTYTINAKGTEITENFMFTNKIHKLKGKQQQCVLKILYLKGDYMVLAVGEQLMYLYRV